MALLLGILTPLQLVIDLVLKIGRFIAVIAIALMVAAILYQVVMRYGFNAAPNWTEEFARFMMLWMTGLIAGSAYRRGGFVAIDLLENALPKRSGAILALFLLAISLVVLVMGLQLGWKHVNSGWLFASSSLRLPLDWFGGQAVKIKLAWMYLSLFVGLVILTAVNVELILRAILQLSGHAADLRPIPGGDVAEAD